MSAGFREAYARLRESYIYSARKHEHPHPDEMADYRINSMTNVELLNMLTNFAEVIDDEEATADEDRKHHGS